MSTLYKMAENNNVVLKIIMDDSPESPREWDNLGTMACFHRRYDLGDKDHGVDHRDFSSWSEMEEYIKKELRACIVLPLFLYDHSGITISTSPFSCRWDSGQIGFIYITREKILEEYGGKRVSAKLKKRVTEYLIGEVEVYDQYLTGDVYRFVLEEKAECDCCNSVEYKHIDSCWGFYGSNFKENGIADHIPAAYKYLLDELDREGSNWMKKCS